MLEVTEQRPMNMYVCMYVCMFLGLLSENIGFADHRHDG